MYETSAQQFVVERKDGAWHTFQRYFDRRWCIHPAYPTTKASMGTMDRIQTAQLQEYLSKNLNPMTSLCF